MFQKKTTLGLNISFLNNVLWWWPRQSAAPERLMPWRVWNSMHSGHRFRCRWYDSEDCCSTRQIQTLYQSHYMIKIWNPRENHFLKDHPAKIILRDHIGETITNSLSEQSSPSSASCPCKQWLTVSWKDKWDQIPRIHMMPLNWVTVHHIRATQVKVVEANPCRTIFEFFNCKVSPWVMYFIHQSLTYLNVITASYLSHATHSGLTLNIQILRTCK